MARNKDVECPYCGKWQEISNDDGFGTDESTTYDQECQDCEKTFVFTVCISLDYSAEPAPCKNGEPHEMKPIWGAPAEFFEGRTRCSHCGLEETDQAIHKAAMKRYMGGLGRG